MKIVLCSTNGSLRERWRSMLQDQQFSLYQASSLEVLQTVIHKNEQYLFLMHQAFADLQTIGTLAKKSDSYKVFVLSDAPTKEDGITLIQSGVVGYANSYISKGRLTEAIRIVESGKVWFGQEIINSLVRSLNVSEEQQGAQDREERQNILNTLSTREKEIAILVSEGMSNHSIAEKLFISERTVKSHLSTIFSKTGAESRLQLALSLRGYKS